MASKKKIWLTKNGDIASKKKVIKNRSLYIYINILADF